MSKIGRGNKITGKRENNRFGSDRVRKKRRFEETLQTFILVTLWQSRSVNKLSESAKSCI